MAQEVAQAWFAEASQGDGCVELYKVLGKAVEDLGLQFGPALLWECACWSL
jgi:hypothetical protein